MLRFLTRLIFLLVALAFLSFLGTAAWVVCDGVTDINGRADLAVVPGHGHFSGKDPDPVLKAQLDKAVSLYKDQKFSLIFVIAAKNDAGEDEADAMTTYLRRHEIPSGVPLENRMGMSDEDIVDQVMDAVSDRNAHSIYLIAPYYDIARLKLLLHHAGIVDIMQAHGGTPDVSDWKKIVDEVVAIDQFLWMTYGDPFFHKTETEVKEKVRKLEEKAEDKLHSHDKV